MDQKSTSEIMGTNDHRCQSESLTHASYGGAVVRGAKSPNRIGEKGLRVGDLLKLQAYWQKMFGLHSVGE